MNIINTRFLTKKSYALKNLTKTDLEIMKCPENQLYNTELLKEEEENKNRGGKKDDFDDLKKSAAKKKLLAAGGYFNPDNTLNWKAIDQLLSEKKRELLKKELEKEENLRQKIKKLDYDLNQMYRFILILVQLPEITRTNYFCYFINDFMCLLNDMRSSLLSKDRAEILLEKYGHLIFNDLGQVQKILHSKQSVEKLELDSYSQKVGCPVNRNIKQPVKIWNLVDQKLHQKWIASKDLYDTSDVCRFAFTIKNYNLEDPSNLTHLMSRLNAQKSSEIRFLPLQTITESLLSNLGEIRLRLISKNTLIAIFRHLSRPQKSGISITTDINNKTEVSFDSLYKILIKATWHTSAFVRLTALELLGQLVKSVLPRSFELKNELERKLFTFMNSSNEELCYEGTEAFEKAGFNEAQICRPEILEGLFNDIENAKEIQVQESLSLAISAILELDLNNTMDQIFDIYCRNQATMDDETQTRMRVNKNVKIKVEEYDHTYFARRCAALCLQNLDFQEEHVEKLFKFIFEKGTVLEFCPLNDPNLEVREAIFQAAKNILAIHGETKANDLMPLLQEQIATCPNTQAFDGLRTNLILLTGELAGSFTDDIQKMMPILEKLVESLSIPSEKVQIAIAKCLQTLSKFNKPWALKVCNTQLDILLSVPSSYAEKRGAAFGIAGLSRGIGLVALKQIKFHDRIKVAFEDRKNPRIREGALMALETTVLFFGRKFEPYLIQSVNDLLDCFGDNNSHVREGAMLTTSVVMANLTRPGVKFILPGLLETIEKSKLWRAKTAAASMVGQMSNLSTRQLSKCLPQIIPVLQSAMTDSHQKVAQSGEDALMEIGNVVTNPEIKKINKEIIDALADPTEKSAGALQALIDTEFEHEIDTSSLALIMPIVKKALFQRSADVRRMAAGIIANMYKLTQTQDILPYLEEIVPGIKKCIVDPVPDVRKSASKAIGAVVTGLKHNMQYTQALIDWLFEKLKSDETSVDRMGAAQSLSEVIYGDGEDRLRAFMPVILKYASDKTEKPYVRDGYSMLFIYLPKVFGDAFLPYVGEVIKPILSALADQTEYVRDTALKAGQVVVKQYCDVAIDELLPELEEGLMNGDWRIRQASVTLLGDMMYHISGVSGKGTTEGVTGEDTNFGTEEGLELIAEKIGEEHRNYVLAGLYLGRNDVEYQVRTAAVHVWKVVVSNTARTLRTILSNLIKLIVLSLSSLEEDTRMTAARCLGDLVKKLGDKLLPDIIPILESDLKSDDANKRRGICNGLSEIVRSSSDEIVEEYAGQLVPTLQQALSDEDEYVQSEAGKIFDALLDKLGDHALEEIIPPIINMIENPEGGDQTISENAMGSLRAIVNAQPRQVAKYLVPRLTEPPVNTNILAFLSKQVPDTFLEHLKKIIRAVVNAMVKAKKEQNDMEAYNMIRNDASVVVSAVNSYEGMKIQLEELVELTKDNEKILHRIAACELLSAISDVKKCTYDFTQIQHQFVLKNVFKFLCYKDESLTDACWEVCVNLMKRVNPATLAAQYDEFSLDEADDLKHNIASIRDAVRQVNMEMKRQMIPPSVGVVGAKKRKKAFDVFWPVLKEGLNRQQSDVREATANAILDLIRLFSAEAIGPSTIAVTGALIKALADRWAASVKSATIQCISELLTKMGLKLVPFSPQLQTALCKNLTEKDLKTRKTSAIAVGQLAAIHRRKDLLLNEILKGLKSDKEASLQKADEGKNDDEVDDDVEETFSVKVNYLETYVFALRQFLINQGGKSITEESCENLIEMLQNCGGTAKMKIMAAACLATLKVTTKHKSIQEKLENLSPLINGCSDELNSVCQAAFYAATIKESSDTTGEIVPLQPFEQLENLIVRNGNDTIKFGCQAFGFAVRKFLLIKNTNKVDNIDMKSFYEKVYIKKCENNPEMKKHFWNNITSAIYLNYPIQLEADPKKVNTEFMNFVCELAAKAGGKSEASNLVKKAADEVLLAFIGQLGVDFVKENCSVDVHNAIEIRLAKNAVVCNKDAQISVVPVVYQNTDYTIL